MKRLILSAVLVVAATAAATAQKTRPTLPDQPPVQPPAGNAAVANMTRAQIVNINANAGMITLRTGTGAAARETQFRLANNARLLGANQQAITDGLRFNGFRSGGNVMFRAGTGDLATTINELHLVDQAAIMNGTILNGQIVNVDAKNSTVVIRTGTGRDARERMFRMDAKARFFNRELAAIEEGLAFRGFVAGTPVWFTTGAAGTTSETITALSLGNPQPPEQKAATGAPTAPMAPGVGTPTPSKYLVGQVVGVDAEGRTLTVKTGKGDDARELTLKVPGDASFFGRDREPLQEGLRSDNIKPGVDVWLRVGTAELANTVRELSLQDPEKKDK